MKVSISIIMKYWRKHWMKKHGKKGRMLLHYFRRSVLVKRVVSVQRRLRGFLGKRRMEKQRMQLIAYERQRKHAEQAAVSKAILNATSSAVASGDFSWVDANGGGNQAPSPKKGSSSSPAGRSSPSPSRSNKGAPTSGNSNADSNTMPDLKYSGNEVRGSGVVEFMEVLDLMCSQIMFDVPTGQGQGQGKSKKIDRRMLKIDPDLSLDALPVKRRISLAVLAAFANHPGGMIHFTALRQAKQFLNACSRPFDSGFKQKGVPITKSSADEEIVEEKERNGGGADGKDGHSTDLEGDGEQSEVQAPANITNNQEQSPEKTTIRADAPFSSHHPNNLYYDRHRRMVDIGTGEDVWESLESSGPLISILEASRWLEPSLALRCRVTVQGHLPDKVLAFAVIIRRWTHWMENTMKRAIWRSRLNLPLPKQACPYCSDSLITPAAERAHFPCPNNQWVGHNIRKEAFLPALATLENRLRNLTEFPALKRGPDKNYVQNVIFKNKARHDEAYRAYKCTGPEDHDEAQKERLAQINARRFIEMAQDMVKRTEEEDVAEGYIRGELSLTPAAKKNSNSNGGSPATETPKNVGKNAKLEVRSPPKPPSPPDGVEHILFVEEFFPKTSLLFAQFDHEEEVRRSGLDEASKNSPGNAGGTSFTSPPKKGAALLFSKSGDYVGKGSKAEAKAKDKDTGRSPKGKKKSKK
jgi:hypothetical protein